jgi:56kDa selenium binding protein (SBP56)
VIDIPAEPAEPGDLPPALQPFGAVPPLVTDIDVDTETGGISLDPRFFPHGDEFRGLRVHQTRLQGGDASSDSYCFPSA